MSKSEKTLLSVMFIENSAANLSSTATVFIS